MSWPPFNIEDFLNSGGEEMRLTNELRKIEKKIDSLRGKLYELQKRKKEIERRLTEINNNKR